MLEKNSNKKFRRLIFISVFLLIGFFIEKSGLFSFLQKTFNNSWVKTIQADVVSTDCGDPNGNDCSSDCSSDCCNDCEGDDCCDSDG